MIKDVTALTLTQDLFHLIKRLPHLRLNVEPIDGLTKSEHELLVVLRMNVNGDRPMLSASEITNLLQITPAGGTHLFNPLIKAGYLRRMQDPRDRRIGLIGLTKKGLETTDTLLAAVQGQITGLIDYLGEADSRLFIRLLSQVFDYLALQTETQPASQNDR